MEFYPVGMQAFVARRVDRLITSSAASRRQIELDFRVPGARLRMLGNGLDSERFRPDPAVPRGDGELLCVARASDPNKGVRTLIAALAQLGPAFRLTLVDDPSPHNEARRWAREHGCADRLRIAGRVSDDELVALYRRAMLVVVPSRYEGFGLPAAEAMACGTPVVAAASGALPEVIETGGGGILVPPEDPDALAKAIATLAEQPDARRAMGTRAPARIEAAYAWPRVAARTAEVYAEVVAERRRGRPERSTTSA
jgi:glycosyltransferase involved in cell wall biosynthesis